MKWTGEGYYEQDGCYNCTHVFRRYEYDDLDCYYCTKGAPPRPPCGSVAMHEAFSDQDNWDTASATWDTWIGSIQDQPGYPRGLRYIEAWGICVEYASGLHQVCPHCKKEHLEYVEETPLGTGLASFGCSAHYVCPGKYCYH